MAVDCVTMPETPSSMAVLTCDRLAPVFLSCSTVYARRVGDGGESLAGQRLVVWLAAL